MARDTITSVTDDVDDNLAEYSNQKKIAIDKLTVSTAYSDYGTTITMSASLTLTDASNPIQSVDTNGAVRDVNLPTVAVTNHPYYIINRGANTITVKNASATVITYIFAGAIDVLYSDGVNGWYSVNSAKRRQVRIYTTTSLAGTPGTLTPEIASYDYFEITAQAAALNIANHSVSAPTGGERMMIAITSDATPRALTYGTAYVAKGGVPLPSTTVASKTTSLLFVYNAGLGKWNLMAVGQEV
jgi:hypothetical protein